MIKKVSYLLLSLLIILMLYVSLVKYIKYTEFKPMLYFVENVLNHPNEINTYFINNRHIKVNTYMDTAILSANPEIYFNNYLSNFHSYSIDYNTYHDAKGEKFYAITAHSKVSYKKITFHFNKINEDTFNLESISF